MKIFNIFAGLLVVCASLSARAVNDETIQALIKATGLKESKTYRGIDPKTNKECGVLIDADDGSKSFMPGFTVMIFDPANLDENGPAEGDSAHFSLNGRNNREEVVKYVDQDKIISTKVVRMPETIFESKVSESLRLQSKLLKPVNAVQVTEEVYALLGGSKVRISKSCVDLKAK